MPKIVEENDTASPIIRLIIPNPSQLIVICKNFTFKDTVSERLQENAQSRSWSGDHKEHDYELSRPVELEDSPSSSRRTLNVVISGDTKKALQVLINAGMISISTYRQVSNALKEWVLYAREPEPLTPTP